MIPSEIIARKRDGFELTDDEIAEFVRGYSSGTIPDYQMSALAMAIYLRGMSSVETAALTGEMLQSGDVLSWPDGTLVVDKHSTGGVGDKVSLILAPLLACCGLRVPMISGRGLGPTGGTLDKLESIGGFRTDLSMDEIQRITQQVGCVITGASPELAPADRKLYALRDVTATVPSIPLITASIMSKKLAEGLNALVLDVKFGSGAFMKSVDDARRLAKSLITTGDRMGVATTAVLTGMNQPLGRMAGNANEVNESIDVLKGGGPEDVRAVTVALAQELLAVNKPDLSVEETRILLEDHIASGRAWEKFVEMIEAQGGRPNAIAPVAAESVIESPQAGCVGSIDTEAIGRAIIAMGGGRRVAGDAIDHSVGLEMLVRIGRTVDRGEPLVKVFSPEPDAVRERILNAIEIVDHTVPLLSVLGERITADDCRQADADDSE